MKYAMVTEDGTIVSILNTPSPEAVELNTPEGTTAVEFDEPSSDPDLFRYDWTTTAFVSVPAVSLAIAPRFTFNEWVDRFPFAAQVAIVTATTTDPVAKLIYDRAMSAGISGSIDPKDPRTVAGVQYLVTAGHITQADADQALA